MKRKTTIWIILMAMLVSMSSCSSTADETETVASTPVTEDTTAVEETEADERDIPDMLPERDFNGQVLKIAAEETKTYEICVEEMTGEVTNDAVYNRNIAIEERFNAEIQAVVVASPQDNISTIVAAGEHAYDIAGAIAYRSFLPIMANTVLNWNDLPYINLDQPWYYNITNQNAEINGKLFNLSSYLSTTTLLDTYAMFFNKEICMDYGYQESDLYSLVYDNKWTYDNFNSILSGIYEDTNGNGTADREDVFGYIGGLCHPLDFWLTAFDQPITSRDSDGMLTVEIMTEKTVSALEKIQTLTYNNTSSFRELENFVEYRFFADGHAAFTPLPFHTAFNELRDMESGYGILPIPKWNEEQTEYRTHIYDQCTMHLLPKTIPQESFEFIGIMMEALCAESYKTVYPAYYDVALKGKYVSDANAADMIDIIMEGAKMDLAFVYSDGYMSRVAFWFRDLINANSTDIASQWQKNEKAIENSIQKIYAAHADKE